MADLVKKDIKYLNKDFAQFRRNLINFTKTYFPNTYNDFNESSPAIGTGTNAKPDMRYAVTVKANATIKTDDDIKFRTLDSVDFKFTSSVDSTDVTVYEIDDTGNVTYYLLKKQVDAVSGELKTVEFPFEDPKIYDKIVLPEEDTNVLEIVEVRDENNELYYEVDYLAQDTIMDSIRNIPFNDPDLSQHEGTVPYILKLKKTARRFVTRLREDGRTEIQFGSGVSSDADEEIIPNPKNVGLGLTHLKRTIDASLDPTNFLYTNTYGIAPSNTTLSVKYSVGGGVQDNVQFYSKQKILYNLIIHSLHQVVKKQIILKTLDKMQWLILQHKIDRLQKKIILLDVMQCQLNLVL